jgi:hypothetical protein
MHQACLGFAHWPQRLAGHWPYPYHVRLEFRGEVRHKRCGHPAIGLSHRRSFIASQVSRTDTLAVNSGTAVHNRESRVVRLFVLSNPSEGLLLAEPFSRVSQLPHIRW